MQTFSKGGNILKIFQPKGGTVGKEVKETPNWPPPQFLRALAGPSYRLMMLVWLLTGSKAFLALHMILC